jgi:type I restriction enzyme S subunit
MTDLPSGWTLAKIPNLLGTLPTGKIIDQGWSPKCENFPSNNDEKWGALKTTAIQNGWFEPQHTKQLPDHLEPKPALEVTAGDVLMTCAGPRVRCGVICRVDKVRPKLFISGKMYRFRPNEEIADGDYLLGVLRSPKLQIAIDQIKTGGSESGLNLTQDRFKSLDIPLPPLPEQRRIVRRLDALTARTTSARTHLTAIAKLVERYRAAVLRLAFSGKLTSDWRTQNPLSQSAEKYLNHLLSVRREKWIDSELRKRPDTNREKTEQRYKEPTLRHSNDLEELPAGWQWLSTGNCPACCVEEYC